jgi:hypothetical protein
MEIRVRSPNRQQLESMAMLRKFQSNLGTVWCTLMHDSMMWPVHGQYECRTCGRQYPAFPEAPAASWSKRPALKTVLSLLFLLTLGQAIRPVRAADQSRTEADAALERYMAGNSTHSWAVESVEIHASLPGLTKSGRLQATRTIDPAGGVRYQIVQITGDRTVKEQVIARYLTAEERASQTPAASVAINAANYKFAYKGMVNDGERHAWAFRITPRKKRSGLIRGELWLDVETGLAIRRSGYLVKSPSVWIRRVEVTQEDSLREGSVDSRLTRITALTRLAGPAELVIAERPLGGNTESADNRFGDQWGKQ